MRPKKSQWRRRLRRALRTLGACTPAINAILAKVRSMDHCLQEATKCRDRLDEVPGDQFFARGHASWILWTIGELEIAGELAARGDYYRSAIVIYYWITGVLHDGDDQDVCRALGSAWILRALEHRAEEIRRADRLCRRRERDRWFALPKNRGVHRTRPRSRL